MQPDVLVIGGGVIGLSVAWRAARAGLSVELLTAGAPGDGTSQLAAGMIAPVSEAIASEQPLLRLGLASAARYPPFLADLADDLNTEAAPPALTTHGTLLVARDNDEAEALERELRLREQLGLSARRLLASQARELEPGLARVRLALEIPEDQALDPRELCGALAHAALRRGVRLRTEAVVQGLLHGPDGRVVGVRLADGSEQHAATTVLAAGVWSGEIAGLPQHVLKALRPVKGQIMRLRDPAGPGLITRVIRMAEGYLVPRADGGYVLGATVEERGFDRSVTVGGIYTLLRDATELVPGLSELVIEETAAGLRPGTADNAPLLGEDPQTPGLLWATGHYRHGVLLAPISAELIVAALTGNPPPLGEPGGLTEADLRSFAPSRFAPARQPGQPLAEAAR